MVPKGFKMSENTKRKISESHKGTTMSPEYCRALSEALKGRTFSESHRKHLSEANIGKKGHPHTEAHKEKMSLLLKGRTFSIDWRKKLSKAKEGKYFGVSNPFWGKRHTDETKKKIANGVLEHRKFSRPNKAEQRLLKLITENKLPYRYVGDGQFILGGKCPDFLNVNGKKQVIELFGTYWHPIFDIAKRQEHFRQYGFDTLFIWEDELKDMEKVTKKLVKFSRSSHGVNNGKQMA